MSLVKKQIFINGKPVLVDVKPFDYGYNSDYDNWDWEPHHFDRFNIHQLRGEKEQNFNTND